MKLTHHLTGTLLALVFAFTTVLPAATIPEIKTPKTVTAPKVPVVKVPTVKVPTAPKVPVVKVPAAPKIPVVKVPSVKVPVTPKIVKVPAAPKVPKVSAAPRIVAAPKAVKTPVAPKVPTVAVVKAPVIAVNTGKLSNLKQKVAVQVKPVEVRDNVRNLAEASGKGGRFVSDNFGPGAGANKPGTFMEGVKQNSGKNNRNPLSGNPTDNLRGDKNSQVSDGGVQRNGSEGARGDSTTRTSSNGNNVTKWDNGTVRVVSADGKTTTTLFPSGQVEETKGGKTTMYDPAGEPLPDDTGSSSSSSSSSSGVVTRNDVRGLNAKRNGTSEPAQNDNGSTGGPVNTSANGTGRTGSLSQPAGDPEGKSIPDVQSTRKNIQIKIDSKINTGGR